MAHAKDPRDRGDVPLCFHPNFGVALGILTSCEITLEIACEKVEDALLVTRGGIIQADGLPDDLGLVSALLPAWSS